MARRKKGRDISGWLIVDKPAGLTSTAVVNKVRWALEAKKAGHAGTLDPAATGILAVALGEATKTMKTMQHRKQTTRTGCTARIPPEVFRTIMLNLLSWAVFN